MLYKCVNQAFRTLWVAHKNRASCAKKIQCQWYLNLEKVTLSLKVIRLSKTFENAKNLKIAAYLEPIVDSARQPRG